MLKKENLPLQVLQLDVTDDRSVVDAIYNISKENNSIDVVVNNAGYGLMGSVEDSSLDEIRAQFETNFFWSYQSNAESNTYNEKTEVWNNS